MLTWVHTFFHWLSQHWGDVVPTWLGVIVAAIFGIQSWRASQQSKAARDAAQAAESRAEAEAERAERATKAAENAAAAADRSAGAAERSAAAQEKQTALLQDAADAEEQFPWQLDRMGSSMDFRLTNRTNARKYQVVVTGKPARPIPGTFRPGGGRSNSYATVDGRERVALDLIVTAQTVDRSVTVSWHPTSDHTGDAWTQRLGLPG